MKFNIVCPNCSSQEEIEMSQDEASGMMFACGKCKGPAHLYNLETGEKISSGPNYMPGVVLYEENSLVQVIIPLGLCKDDIVKSLKTITEAIESDGAVGGVVLAEVAISMEADRMVIMKKEITSAESCEEA